MYDNLVAGVDFGSDSVRAVIVDIETGATVAQAESKYKRWQNQLFCDPTANQFRQHPLDYIESLEECVNKSVNSLDPQYRVNLKSIAIDTTGSTPCPVNREGTPLALLEEFADNPNAMFHLWKDHTAVEEAKEINRVFSAAKIDYTKYQGTYSSEWFWAKILHTIRVDKKVREAAYSWVEHVDWMPALLTGLLKPETMSRCYCAAGHKALWHSDFGGLPDTDCLNELDSYLGLIAERYTPTPVPAGSNLGVISEEWSRRLNVPANTLVSSGSFDAHAGAVGAGVKPGTLVKVVGTSTVDMLIAKPETLKGKDLKPYCGLAENSIVPGYVGIEAGQAAFGDVNAWFSRLLQWPLDNLLDNIDVLTPQQQQSIKKSIGSSLIASLETTASTIDIEPLFAVDWFNGRRYPFLNENVTAAIMGLNLGTTAPEIYHALVQSTVMGSKRIFDSLTDNGIVIDKLILVGGIARKSPFTMQMMSDFLNRSIMVSSEDQVCARGAAIYAAAAAGFFRSISDAQESFCEPYRIDFMPDESKSNKYDKIYKNYLACGSLIEAIASK